MFFYDVVGNLGNNLRPTVSPGLSPQHRPSSWTPHPPTTPAYTPAGTTIIVINIDLLLKFIFMNFKYYSIIEFCLN